MKLKKIRLARPDKLWAVVFLNSADMISELL
jgi:hypothetical protein